MNVILFDGEERNNLLPLTFTKPVAELRMGGLSFTERWKRILETTNVSFLSEEYLSKKYPAKIKDLNLFINPAYFPNQELIFKIKNLQQGEALYQNEKLIAANCNYEDFKFSNCKKNYIDDISFHIQYPWDLFTYNSLAITYDFQLITQNRKSCPLSQTVRVIGDTSKIFIEEGAVAEHVIINTKEGEIYLDKNSEVMEGSMIRGGLMLGEGSKINMGAKIYGGTTIGPYSKVGGEVSNSIFSGYSNKGHEGFLGNSILGEWCNLGADTNSSNMKNNYSEVKFWNYHSSKFIDSKLQFAGLIMGDHSKSAINTQFNTGTVVGVSSNIFLPGFPPKLIDSFSWGGKKDSPLFQLEKVYDVMEKVMLRRNKQPTQEDKDIIKYLYSNCLQKNAL